MELKSNTRNESFKRDEVSFVIENDKTPSFDEMRERISDEMKKPEETIKVYNVKGNFGLKRFNVYAYVYDSEEDLKKAEQKSQKQIKAAKEEAKKAHEESKKAKAEAAKPAEAPAEVPAEPAEAPAN